MMLVEAVREAIEAFFENLEQTEIIYATYTDGGLKTDSTLINIPMERVDIPKIFSQQGVEIDFSLAGKNTEKAVLKDALADGDKVVVAAHHKGQRYSVLYKL